MGFQIEPTIGLLIVAIIGFFGVALKLFVDSKATQTARALAVADRAEERRLAAEDREQARAQRAEQQSSLGRIEVNVDGKLEEILDLSKKYEYLRGKEAAQIEAAAAAIVPAVVASVVPEVLPAVVKLIVEQQLAAPREGPEPAPAPVAAPVQPAPVTGAVLNLTVLPTAPTDLDITGKAKEKPEEPPK